MSQMFPLFGGFFLAVFAVAAIMRWAMAFHAQYINQPAEARRFGAVAPLFLLHSGPWAVGLLIFGGFKLLTGPAPAWQPWLLAGFGLGVLYMLITAVWGWRKVQARKLGAHER